jgi:DNA polymerase elongation subunit (family B)
VFGLEDYGVEYPGSELDHVEYYGFEDEEELLTAFVKYWVRNTPDIVTGWNIDGFDIPYLINRIIAVLGEKWAYKLSPWGKLESKTFEFNGVEQSSYNIIGISILDYQRLYKKYTFEPRENWQLGYVCSVELDMTKVAHDEYENFSQFYRNDYVKFIDYNIQDSILIEALERKLNLIGLTIFIAGLAHCNYEDVYQQVRTWDCFIYSYLLRKGTIVPFKTTNSKDEKYEGAWVKDPVPGMYRWVCSFDVTSLYPSIIMALNIGVETLVEVINKIGVEAFLTKNATFTKAFTKALEKNLSLSVNGVYYSKEKISFFSEMIAMLFAERVDARKLLKEAKNAGDQEAEGRYDTKQMAMKIMMNSLYGAMGSQYFRFFSVQNAEAVTITGKFIINYMEENINALLNRLFKTENIGYVIYCDTDSVYIHLEHVQKHILKGETDIHKVTDFLAKLCKDVIEPKIAATFKDIEQNFLNAVEGKLSMKREVIANVGIWKAKKAYILNVIDSEGERFALGDKSPDKKHRKAKMKALGVEIKKAISPQFCKDKMTEAVNIIMNGGSNDDVLNLIKETKQTFLTLEPHEIAFPRGVRDLTDKENDATIYESGTQINAKAALIYNHLIEKKRLQNKYPLIKDGDKIKYVLLKVPNPTPDKVIGFLRRLPPEFNLHQFIDYDTQFDRTFIRPLKSLLDIIGWHTEKVSSLSKWF